MRLIIFKALSLPALIVPGGFAITSDNVPDGLFMRFMVVR